MNLQIDASFRQTCRIVLGSELPGGIDDYGQWLGRHVPLPTKVKSAASDKEVWIPPGNNYLKKARDPARTISLDEIDTACQSKLKPEDILLLPLHELIEKAVQPIAYYCGNFRYGECDNVEECSGAGGQNIYRCEDVYFGSRNCAFSNFTSYCENMFGCNASPFSKFCIHAYNSSNLTRCFEVDGCTNSSDLYFCHDCEGMSNAILCFNAKNLHYAVGNTEVGPERFAEIKNLLLGHILSQLKSRQAYDKDIYNVGCL